MGTEQEPIKVVLDDDLPEGFDPDAIGDDDKELPA